MKQKEKFSLWHVRLPWQTIFDKIYKNTTKKSYLCVCAYPENYNNKIIIILNMEQVFHVDGFGVTDIMKKVIYMFRCQVEIINVLQYRLERL